MIGRYSFKARPRQLGCVTLLVLLASTAVLAQNPPDAPFEGGDAGPDMHHDPAFAPPCTCANKNHEQGVVLLKVLVGADGAARKVEADPDNKASPELTKAASDAAGKWHYPPKQDNSTATEAWIKVPVLFSLALLPPHPPGPPHGDMPPPPGTPMPPPPTGQPAQPSSPNS
ncbi:energy transducer TonB [Dyella nitratireducens]|uniref:TonB C-terminal domain-containing protein n=1 Tax=Dyella nitratireducens TaxID=1849580 RepID=A0ABQ1G5D5_9GAMM|nr:energy transducer TonB [Dyella nitratireducens]GGA36530.1 hypothetical protein GCM10010981_27040 [Dyella nitratireducens]GLQ41082.1 hypothetical protein GCM10007902_09320 [Dyella nitratireducens]